VLNLVRWFGRWSSSLRNGRTPLDDQSPWISLAAIDYLESILHPEARVFEWGSGGSTLFLASRARSVVSVEHNRQWFEQVRTRAAQLGLTNCEILLIEPEPGVERPVGDPSDWNGYVSSAAEFSGCTFRNYVTFIDSFADEYFDLILIDGRARPSCFKHALRKVRVDGHIVWDNTERSYYEVAMRHATERASRADLPGPLPYMRAFVNTTVFRRDA
jgi:hypothetical protein